VFGQSGNDAARIAAYLGPNGDQAVFRAVSARVARAAATRALRRRSARRQLGTASAQADAAATES